MGEDFTLAPCVLETFKLGDAVYSWALLRTITNKLGLNVAYLATSNYTCRLPYGSEITTVAFNAPWLELGWGSRPLAFARAIFDARSAVKKLPSGTVVLSPRGGGIDSLIGSGHYNKRYCMTKRNECGRRWVLGLPEKHPFLARQEVLNKYLRITGNRPLELDWPFLMRGGDVIRNRSVLLAPFAGSSAREWPLESWKQLGVAIERTGMPCSVLSDGRKITECPWLAARLRHVNLAEIVGFVSSISFVIATDSFIGHLSAACGVPVLSLFGPQSVDLWRPWGNRNLTVQSLRFNEECLLSRRTIEAAGPALMRDIKAETIASIFTSWADGELDCRAEEFKADGVRVI